MDDIFRSFFGFPGGHRRGRQPSYDDEEDGGFPFDGTSPPTWNGTGDHDDDDMGEHFHHEVDDMFRHFEEMFKSMGMIDFPPIRPHIPGIGAPSFDHGDQTAPSLRDRMLKKPDSDAAAVEIVPGDHQSPWSPHVHPQPPSIFGNIRRVPQWDFRQSDDKQDIDLDEEVCKEGLRILPRNGPITPKNEEPQIRSQFRSQSVRVIRGADGKVEEHRTVTDGQGNKETTVTRHMGDQTYTVTTKEDGQGGQQKTEDFTNINQNDVDEFERRWNNPTRRGLFSPPQDPRNELILPDQDQQTSSIFKRLFGFNLPGSGSV